MGMHEVLSSAVESVQGAKLAGIVGTDQRQAGRVGIALGRCHAVAQKVVGPAYHDVALKYKADPAAVSKLEGSIKAGGSGKWGPVAMPPFAQLTDAQLKALAEFVMKQ